MVFIMRYIVDRFEGNIAVCEDENKKLIHIPKYKLPLETKEGDCLIEEDGFFRIDDLQTASRKEYLKKKMDRLFE